MRQQRRHTLATFTAATALDQDILQVNRDQGTMKGAIHCQYFEFYLSINTPKMGKRYVPMGSSDDTTTSRNKAASGARFRELYGSCGLISHHCVINNNIYL
jgi:hypothetical protein